MGQKHCSSCLEHLTSAGGLEKGLRWAQREGWARDFTYLACGPLGSHSGYSFECGCTLLHIPLVDPCSRNPTTHSLLPCSQCTAFLHMALGWPPGHNISPQRRPPLHGFMRGGAEPLNSPHHNTSACLTLFSSRVPRPRLPHPSKQLLWRPWGPQGLCHLSLRDLGASSESSAFLSCYIDS